MAYNTLVHTKYRLPLFMSLCVRESYTCHAVRTERILFIGMFCVHVDVRMAQKAINAHPMIAVAVTEEGRQRMKGLLRPFRHGCRRCRVTLSS